MTSPTLTRESHDGDSREPVLPLLHGTGGHRIAPQGVREAAGRLRSSAG